jgi:hypothetical protein
VFFVSSFFYLFVELYLCCINVDLLKKAAEKRIFKLLFGDFFCNSEAVMGIFLGKKVRICNG